LFLFFSRLFSFLSAMFLFQAYISPFLQLCFGDLGKSLYNCSVLSLFFFTRETLFFHW
jgi:hypothetical protein